jgi:hypothetical protein
VILRGVIGWIFCEKSLSISSTINAWLCYAVSEKEERRKKSKA